MDDGCVTFINHESRSKWNKEKINSASRCITHCHNKQFTVHVLRGHVPNTHCKDFLSIATSHLLNTIYTLKPEEHSHLKTVTDAG